MGNRILSSDPVLAARRLEARARRIHPGLGRAQAGSLAELLASWPVMSRSELTTRMSAAAARPHWLDSAVLYSETSGTTGTPLPTPRGAVELAWNAANQAAAYLRFLQPGVDRVAVVHPSILSPFVEASTIALRESSIGHLRVFPIPRVCDYQRMFEVFERFRVTTVMSTPSLVRKLMYMFVSQGARRLPRDWKRCLLTGEPLGTASMGNLQRILGEGAVVAPLVYGSSEAATLMLGRADGCFDPLLDDFVFELVPDQHGSAWRLLVSWLRDGLMPILRYDTGDDFELHATEPQVLRFLGRGGPASRTRRLLEAVEQAVYGLDVPVFHYQGRFSEQRGQLQLDLVLEPSSAPAHADIVAALQSRLPAWELSLRLNPGSIDFMQFSPLPKSERLVRC